MRDVFAGGSLAASLVRRSSVIWARTSAGLKVPGLMAAAEVEVMGLGDEGEGGEVGEGGR